MSDRAQPETDRAAREGAADRGRDWAGADLTVTTYSSYDRTYRVVDTGLDDREFFTSASEAACWGYIEAVTAR